MNRERAKELLPIIQAFVEGKDVQWNRNGHWRDCVDNVGFKLTDRTDYRIKPEPREFWVLMNESFINGNRYTLWDYKGVQEHQCIHVREVL